MIIKVGITGGIGSGKSTVAKVFEVLGVPVYYADDAAKRLMNEDAVLKEKLTDIFGVAAYTDGVLNRSYLSSLVFNNPDKLELLNAIVHPATLKDAEEWMLLQTTPYSIKEAALIFESDAEKNLDYVIGVSAPQDLRMERVMQRDNITRDEVIARMNKQMDEATKMRLCNYVIYNDEEQLVIPQVMELHEKLIAISNKKL